MDADHADRYPRAAGSLYFVFTVYQIFFSFLSADRTGGGVSVIAVIEWLVYAGFCWILFRRKTNLAAVVIVGIYAVLLGYSWCVSVMTCIRLGVYASGLIAFTCSSLAADALFLIMLFVSIDCMKRRAGISKTFWFLPAGLMSAAYFASWMHPHFFENIPKLWIFMLFDCVSCAAVWFWGLWIREAAGNVIGGKNICMDAGHTESNDTEGAAGSDKFAEKMNIGQ